jgi:hypothetical protein
MEESLRIIKDDWRCERWSRGAKQVLALIGEAKVRHGNRWNASSLNGWLLERNLRLDEEQLAATLKNLTAQRVLVQDRDEFVLTGRGQRVAIALFADACLGDYRLAAARAVLSGNTDKSSQSASASPPPIVERLSDFICYRSPCWW